VGADARVRPGAPPSDTALGATSSKVVLEVESDVPVLYLS